MTQGESESESETTGGELFSFLHLTGFRPIVLAVLAGLAGAVGVFLALQEPPEFQARFVLSADRVADNDATAGELDLVVEEIVSTSAFPEVFQAVEDRTGLVFEDDYQINVNRAGGALININVVAADPEDAEQVAIETGIEAVSITTEREIAGVESSRDQLLDDLADVDLRVAELTALAGGVNPAVALDNAQAALLARRADEANPPTQQVLQPDGTFETRLIPLTGPDAEQLAEDVAELAPLEREFLGLQTTEAALNVRLAERNNSIREAESAIDLIETERENQVVIRRVETEETSRIAGLLSGLLVFAVPAALVVILFFTLLDFIRPPSKKEPEHAFEPAGSLPERRAPRALPAARRPSAVRPPKSRPRIRPLTVVDQNDDEDDDVLAEDVDSDNEPDFYIYSDEYGDDEYDDDDDYIETTAVEQTAVFGDDDDDDDEDDDDDDDNGGGGALGAKDDGPPKKPNKSKDGRWGRDASSKAG